MVFGQQATLSSPTLAWCLLDLESGIIVYLSLTFRNQVWLVQLLSKSNIILHGPSTPKYWVVGRKKNVDRLEENLSRHRLIEKLGILHHRHTKRKKFQCKLNMLDKQNRDLMLNAKKECRCIKSGQIPFLPEAALWIRWTQVYRSLLRFNDGCIPNQGKLKRTARRCGIEHCFNLKVEEILLWLQVCIQKCDYFWKNGKQYRQKHLNDCLSRARYKEDIDKEWKILGIIQCKKDRSFWRRLNNVMGKPRSRLVQPVLVED